MAVVVLLAVLLALSVPASSAPGEEATVINMTDIPLLASPSFSECSHIDSESLKTMTFGIVDPRATYQTLVYDTDRCVVVTTTDRSQLLKSEARANGVYEITSRDDGVLEVVAIGGQLDRDNGVSLTWSLLLWFGALLLVSGAVSYFFYWKSFKRKASG